MLYKFPDTYLDEAYSHYKDKVLSIKYMDDKPVSLVMFKKINSMFGRMLASYVLLGREVGLPHGLGTIVAVKYERKNRFMTVRSYNSESKNIDPDNTSILDRFGYKIKFRRNGLLYNRPVTGFKFIPAWSFKEKLRLLIKNGHGGRFSYLTSKTLHRDEI